MKFTEDQITRIGGTRWNKPGTDEVRYYLDWQTLLALDVERYRTGNISSASLAGNKISNAEAARLLRGDPKAWWADGSLHATRDSHLAARLGELTAAIAARLGEDTPTSPRTPPTPAAAPQEEPTPALPDGCIRIRMPRGPAGEHIVDLTTLTPKARALAEAIAATDLRWVRIRSTMPLVDQYAEGADLVRQVLGDVADQPADGHFEAWSANPTPAGCSIPEILEREARKMPGWYPVKADGSDLPSSPAAKADDGLTADQCVALIATLVRKADPLSTAPPTKIRWMRYAPAGDDGYPAPATHNGSVSLWSAADVAAYAAELILRPRTWTPS